VNALSQIARTFRIRVGESLATVERHSVPLAEATTSSLEALRAYTSAVKISLSSGGSASIPFFRRAVEVDPKFALAHAYLGLEYSGNGESAKSVESTAKAWALRDRVSDRERFFIDFTYDRQVTGNLEKAYRTLELWLQTYPRGEEPGFALGPQNPQGLLGGISTHGTGRFERVIEASQKEIALDPDFAIAYTNLALGYFYTDRFSDVEGTLQRAATRKAELDILRVIRYNTAVLQGDQQEMDRAAALARSNRVDPHWMDHLESLALARSGRLQGARRLSNRAVELALHGQEPEAAATYAAVRAVWEAICGNASEGKASAMAALKLSKGRDVSYAAGLALALSGVSASQTEALVRDLEKRFPDDTFARFTYVPVLHGLVSLGRSELQDSVERLELARPYEVAVNGLNFAHFYMGGLHSAYVRGEALLALHRYSEAAGEFQRILDHRGLVGADPLGVLAHWRLGRAFALSGDRAKAKTAYQAFFSSWKDADPSVPVLRTARAEYQRL
jgi:tetratricopeptide (TPR) repeat protein